MGTVLIAYSAWKYPDIPGIQTYKGKLMHSAAWDDSYDLTGKTVAVIGGGSSAVQVIPSIQPRVKKLIPYLRSPVWITAGFGAKYAAPGGVNFQCTYTKWLRYPPVFVLGSSWLIEICRHRRPEGSFWERP